MLVRAVNRYPGDLEPVEFVGEPVDRGAEEQHEPAERLGRLLDLRDQPLHLAAGGGGVGEERGVEPGRHQFALHAVNDALGPFADVGVVAIRSEDADEADRVGLVLAADGGTLNEPAAPRTAIDEVVGLEHAEGALYRVGADLVSGGELARRRQPLAGWPLPRLNHATELEGEIL